jgi:hypothetical protein
MKLLTDERNDVEAYKSDFDRACRNVMKVMKRAPMHRSKESLANGLIWGTRSLMTERLRGGPCYDFSSRDIEFLHAMDWQVVIIERWLANQADSRRWSATHAIPRDPSELGNPDDHAAEMFVGIAQRVAADFLRGSLTVTEDE